MLEPIIKAEFQYRTGISNDLLCPAWQAAERIVSLRSFKAIIAVSDMPKPYLRALIDSICLTGDPNCFPYRGCKIDLVRSDPQHLRIGQTFVENSKCLNLIDQFLSQFWSFAGTRGFAKLTAKIVLGLADDGKLAVAHYLPPLIEQHNETLVLLDGNHRNFVARGVGTTVESLAIRKVKVAFPCDWHKWVDIRRVDAKPPAQDRFFNLQPLLFRDLKAIGIDG